MRTNKFEDRITKLIAFGASIWLNTLPRCMQMMQVISFKLDVEYAGVKYQAFGKYELNLMDEIHFINIGQRDGVLDFYYASINPDETSDECFDAYFEKAMTWRELNRRKI